MLELVTNSVVTRLDNVLRFNGERIIGQRENITQHSYWVTILSNTITEQLFGDILITGNLEQENWYLNLYRLVVKKAMLHDVDEAITGDIVFPTKHHPEFGNKLQESLFEIILDYVEKNKSNDLVLSEYNDFVLQSAAGVVGSIQYKIAQMIVKISDWMSCFKVCHEQSNLGSASFTNMKYLCIGYIGSSIDKLIDYLDKNDIYYNKKFIIDFKDELVSYKLLNK